MHGSDGAVLVNGDIYSLFHFLICKRDNEIKAINVTDILLTDLIYNFQSQGFVAIENYDKNTDITIDVYAINVEPQDFYFTENGLSFDSYPTAW